MAKTQADQDQTTMIQDDTEIERSAPAAQARRGPRSGDARASARGEVRGRNGELLSRKRTGTKDIFDIPKEMIPEGWEYQWCAVSVVGNTEILLDQNLQMAENGWRPVPSSRYPGRFMPEGHKGNITRGGQLLMERPKVLSDEARAEDIRNARQLISDRNESLKLGSLNRTMPEGFEGANQHQQRRYNVGGVRMQIDRNLDTPLEDGRTGRDIAPQHTLAEPGE